MFKAMNPPGVKPPARHYIHSIELPPNCRVLSVSGQVAVRPDGSIPTGISAQTEVCWQNIVNILRASDMGVRNVFKVVQYLTRVEDRDAHMAVRNRFLGDHKPTSTLLFVSALAQPEFIVEVEVWAAAPQ
jgi:enamine deaminase RidA (YjgF/YER057c/UK114 family)